ncbi:hypothetical protein EMPG_14808 [Blastomyces silverae]|uniref:Uncharacterized protein n=1 Tax=Blastomyces silverae TaxID=2060906 RepID=A0A0H1BEH9_9EURO|nr:hypothetical protein EMPG_14808 [Blastomyces silverae]
MEGHIPDLHITGNADPEAALVKEALAEVLVDTMVDLNLGDETLFKTPHSPILASSCSKSDHSSPMRSDTWSA